MGRTVDDESQGMHRTAVPLASQAFPPVNEQMSPQDAMARQTAQAAQQHLTQVRKQANNGNSLQASVAKNNRKVTGNSNIKTLIRSAATRD